MQISLQLSDEDLMMRTRDDDMEAFETLVRRHYNRLALYISHVLGNVESAEDLVQETFLRAYRARHQYVPKAKWTTWVRKIALNLTRDERRRQANIYFCSLDDTPQDAVRETLPLHEIISDEDTPLIDRILCDRETACELEHEVANLSPKHAEILRMRIYEEMNYREIADNLGCSLGTVKSRIHYAIEELRARYVGERMVM